MALSLASNDDAMANVLASKSIVATGEIRAYREQAETRSIDYANAKAKFDEDVRALAHKIVLDFVPDEITINDAVTPLVGQNREGLRAVIERDLRDSVKQALDNGSRISDVAGVQYSNYSTELDSLFFPGEAPMSADRLEQELKAINSRFVQNRRDGLLKAVAATNHFGAVLMVAGGTEDVVAKSGVLHLELSSNVTPTSTSGHTSMATSGPKVTSQVVTRLRCKRIKVEGNIERRAEVQGVAVTENAIMAQLASGKTVLGQRAPGLNTSRDEHELLRLVESGSVSTPFAAGCAMLTTLLGWYQHMTQLNGAQQSRRSFNEWVNLETEVHVNGYHSGDLFSGLSDIDAVKLGGIMGSDGHEFGYDEEGSVFISANYRSLLMTYGHDALASTNRGTYLLTIPRKGKGQDSLTAAALAMTACTPSNNNAEGHMQLMTVGKECNVSFISGINGTAGALVNTWRDTVLFGPDEVIELIGHIADRHLGGSTSSLHAASYIVGSLFSPQSKSHHDGTNVVAAVIPRIGHPNCEPMLDVVMATRNGVGHRKLAQDAHSMGKVTIRSITQMAQLVCMGESIAHISVAQSQPLALLDCDIKAWQKDYGFGLMRIASDQGHNEYHDLRYANTGSGRGNNPDVGGLAMNAMGMRNTDSNLSGHQWHAQLELMSPGCAYVFSDITKTRLRKLIVRDWEDGRTTMEHAVLCGDGQSSTVDGQGKIVSAITHPGSIVECGGLARTRALEIGINLWNDDPRLAFDLMDAIWLSSEWKQVSGAEIEDTHKEELEDIAKNIEVRARRCINNFGGNFSRADEEYNLQDIIELVYETKEGLTHRAERPELCKTRIHTVMTAIVHDLMAHVLAMYHGMDEGCDVGCRQAIAIGWWSGGHTAQLARLYAVMAASSNGLIVPAFEKEGASANGKYALYLVAARCMLSNALITCKSFMTLSSVKGPWSSIGLNIAGGQAIPAHVIGWNETDVVCLDEDDDNANDVAETLDGIIRSRSGLTFKINTRKVGARASILSRDERLANNVRGALRFSTAVPHVQERLLHITYEPGEHRTGDRLMLGRIDPSVAEKANPKHSDAMMAMLSNAVAEMGVRNNEVADIPNIPMGYEGDVGGYPVGGTAAT